MQQAYVINADGYMIDVVLVESGTPPTDDTITATCPNGFYAPRWNGTAWEEGMNIYFEYVTAASCERGDGKILTTGEIMWAWKGSRRGEWTEVDAGCAVIGPFRYDTAPQIYLDAGADDELYFIQNEVVLIKPDADAIKQAREANRVPTTEEQVSKLQKENQSLTSQNKALYDSVNFMMDYLTTNGTIV